MNIKKRSFQLLFIMTIIIIFSGLSPVMKASASQRILKVGVFELNGFFHKGDDQNPTGYGIEYLEKIAEKTGWRYEYIWAENWDECVQFLREGKVDIIAPAQKTESRMEEFDFPALNIGNECGTLLALSTNEKLIYEDFSAFSSITIGCVDTLVFKEDFIKYADSHNFTPNIVSYRDTKALLAALNSGEIDAALTNLFVQTDTTKVLAKFGISPFYFMFRRNQPLFQKELDDALQQIKTEYTNFEADLLESYYPAFSNVPFTKAELEYIKEAPVFKVACRSNIRPISYVDSSGEVMGITRQILDEVSRISGFKFEYAALPEGHIVYDYFREHDITLISSVEYNKENISAPGMRLSIPYLDSKKVFVCKKDEFFDTDKPLTIAVATGSETLIDAIKKSYPNFQLKVYNSVYECFESVRKNETDALLQNQYVVTTFLAKPLYSEMKIIPVESLRDQLCLSPVVNMQEGVENPLLADSRLVSILNKSINQISETDISKIIIKETTENQYRYTYLDIIYNYRHALFIIVIILIILFAALIHSHKLKKKNLKLITDNEAKLRNITNNINGGVVVLTVDEQLRITYANDGFMNLLQCGPDEYYQIQNKEYTTYVHPDDTNALKELMTIDINKNNQVSFKLRIMNKSGQYIPTLFNGTLTESSKGEREIYCVIMDISEQEQLFEKLSLQQKKYSAVIESSGDIIFEIDCIKKEFIVSSLFKRKFGWKVHKAAITNTVTDSLGLLQIHAEDISDLRNTTERIFTEKAKVEAQARIYKTDGNFLWCYISMHPMLSSSERVINIVGRISDIDEEVRTKKELEQKSRIDSLTGLLNKHAFFEEASQYLENSNGKNSALIFLDIDNFKQVNDKLGHMEGDRAIKETAKKLQIIFSNYDILARFGGDEFCILLKEIPLNTLRDKLAWAVEKLRNVYSSDGIEVKSSVSIGAACTYGKRESIEVLLEYADKALYKSKENGKNQYTIYNG